MEKTTMIHMARIMLKSRVQCFVYSMVCFWGVLWMERFLLILSMQMENGKLLVWLLDMRSSSCSW